MASNHVEAQGVLVTVVKSTQALVMLCKTMDVDQDISDKSKQTAAPHFKP